MQDLKTVVRNAMADGYVNTLEAFQIQKQALLNDNTVNYEEKAFLRDVYKTNQHTYLEPFAHRVFNKLINYGETSINVEMENLRERKVKERWFTDEYLKNVIPTLLNSTDNLTDRMNQLRLVKVEARMFTSEYEEIAKKLIVENSHDPVVVRMNELKKLKTDANLFNSEYQEIGKQILLNSYDNLAARLKSLDQFKTDANLFNSEYEELKKAILSQY